MTPIEKVKEIAKKFEILKTIETMDIEVACNMMHEWDKQQFAEQKQSWIKKAATWFANHAEDYIEDDGGKVMPYINLDCYTDFKKAMEAEP